MPAFSVTLTSDSNAPTSARTVVREFLGQDCPSQLVIDACLLTSEIVSNCVRHMDEPGESNIDVTGHLSDEILWVEVTDSGGGFEPLTSASSNEVGWSVVIVDRVADRWGTLKDPSRTWFELDRGDG